MTLLLWSSLLGNYHNEGQSVIHHRAYVWLGIRLFPSRVSTVWSHGTGGMVMNTDRGIENHFRMCHQLLLQSRKGTIIERKSTLLPPSGLIIRNTFGRDSIIRCATSETMAWEGLPRYAHCLWMCVSLGCSVDDWERSFIVKYREGFTQWNLWMNEFHMQLQFHFVCLLEDRFRGGLRKEGRNRINYNNS